MSGSTESIVVGIGPSGSSQLTVQLTPPSTPVPTASLITFTTTVTTSTIFTVTPMSTTSVSAPTASSSTSTPASPFSRTPHLAAIIGGTVGGVVAILWFIGLMYFAHHYNWFRRPGYRRHKEERGTYGKRRSMSPTSELGGPFADNRPPPQTGIGARAFGEPRRAGGYGAVPPRASFVEPRRTSYGEQRRNSFGDLVPPVPVPPPQAQPPPPPPPPQAQPPPQPQPQPQAQSVPPPRPPPPQQQPQNYPQQPPPQQQRGYNDAPRATSFGDGARSGFGERPISGFATDRERERERDRRSGGYADRRSMSPDRHKRSFFGSAVGRTDSNEWEGAGRRIGPEPGTPEMQEQSGLRGFFARARERAAQKKRVRAEYEEDMRRMRGRSAVESDYGRY